jgi:hypothetical protein
MVILTKGDLTGVQGGTNSLQILRVLSPGQGATQIG